MSKLYVIHENDAWMPPFRAAFGEAGLAVEEWHLATGGFTFQDPPPEGLFYNRMSASAHTRGHRHAPLLAQQVITWLEHHGRRVVNGSRALSFELTKVAQYAALAQAGIEIPRTSLAVSRGEVLARAADFAGAPFILKPNRGGKGHGVRLIREHGELEDYLRGPDYEEPVDGAWLLQEYLRSDDPFITRLEFIGGRFHYAVRVDASQGFALCPADACDLGDSLSPGDAAAKPDRFEVLKDFEDPLIGRIEALLAKIAVEVAGIEFIRTGGGRTVVYDLNTNTNYNAAAEGRAELAQSGPQRLAAYLSQELRCLEALAAAE